MEKNSIPPEDQAYYLHEAWMALADKFSHAFKLIQERVSEQSPSEYESPFSCSLQVSDIANSRKSMWFLDQLFQDIKRAHCNASNKRHFENLEGIQRIYREQLGLQIPTKLDVWEK